MVEEHIVNNNVWNCIKLLQRTTEHPPPLVDTRIYYKVESFTRVHNTGNARLCRKILWRGHSAELHCSRIVMHCYNALSCCTIVYRNVGTFILVLYIEQRECFGNRLIIGIKPEIRIIGTVVGTGMYM